MATKKSKELYYVISIDNPRVLQNITSDLISKILHYKYLLTIKSFARCETLAEARKLRKENGGIILRGVSG